MIKLWRNKIGIATFVMLLVWLSACNGKQTPAVTQQQTTKLRSLEVKYAKGFVVDYYKGFKVITVKDSKDSARILISYVLIAKGQQAPANFSSAILIDSPAQKIICVSTTHVAEMQKLNLIDHIAGVTNVKLLYDKEVTDRVNRKEIADVGQDELNYEKLVELNPSFVFASGSYDGGDKMKAKLDALHIKSVLNLDYTEQDPLARAEWIKFVAAFFNAESYADSVFKEVESNYHSLQQKVSNVSTKPAVFCNLPFKEIWYMPCKGNYMTRLFTDAGGDFLWKDASSNNGLNLNLDYEAVYNKAANADYWINTGFAESLEQIKSADKKNAFFKAFKTGKVYNNNLRNTAAGGFDFWESGVANPDKILADLIFILHPDLLPGHQLYYYQKLK